MNISLQVFAGSIKMKPEGRRQRTVMLPRPIVKEISGLITTKCHEELSAVLMKIWDAATKSSLGFYWYPPETNPDLQEEEER